LTKFADLSKLEDPNADDELKVELYNTRKSVKKPIEAFRQVLSLIEDFGMQEQQKDAEAASINSDSGAQPSSSM